MSQLGLAHCSTVADRSKLLLVPDAQELVSGSRRDLLKRLYGPLATY